MIAVIATVAWILYVASITVGYLVPAIGGAVDQVLELIAGDEGSRELFRSATGVAAPLWEQAVGYGSVAVMLLTLPIALPIIRRRWPSAALPVTLGLIALLYPVSLLARLTARGAELAARSAEFIFVGAAFVAAIAALAILDAASERMPSDGWRSVIVVRLMSRLQSRRASRASGRDGPGHGRPDRAVHGRRRSWASHPGRGSPVPTSWQRTHARSARQGIDAATWTLGALGPGRRFLSDRTDRVLLATYGRQHPISSVGDKVNLRSAYFDTTLTPEDRDLLTWAGVDYVIADHRLPTSLPYVGVYVERGEQP